MLGVQASETTLFIRGIRKEMCDINCGTQIEIFNHSLILISSQLRGLQAPLLLMGTPGSDLQASCSADVPLSKKKKKETQP